MLCLLLDLLGDLLRCAAVVSVLHGRRPAGDSRCRRHGGHNQRRRQNEQQLFLAEALCFPLPECSEFRFLDQLRIQILNALQHILACHT